MSSASPLVLSVSCERLAQYKAERKPVCIVCLDLHKIQPMQKNKTKHGAPGREHFLVALDLVARNVLQMQKLPAFQWLARVADVLLAAESQ